ncbi:MAG: hypothetical protein DDT42_01956 [candidate division WS2 bacterium]|uniref:Peptidase M1 membrane alanine aminopeptidase domain-containing protein n=1 Tax=Psychracetigena formicireducens TaxID=2986056 RepID=A0A9E2BJ39_PSYF1|nr:hypothetical protein [Candidatus Psychracetigena formicireducens]
MSNACFKRLIFFCGFLLAANNAKGQAIWDKPLDSLRGTLYPHRAAVDVTYYDIFVDPRYYSQTIEGRTIIYFSLLIEQAILQWELSKNFSISNLLLDGNNIDLLHRKEDHFFINSKQLKVGNHTLEVRYKGKPVVSQKPPWEGGFVWHSFPNSNDYFIGTTVEGEGALLWYPCKDHLSDKPNGARVSALVEAGYSLVCGGVKKVNQLIAGAKYFQSWEYSYPVPTYSIAINIGKYVHFTDSLRQSNGKSLALDYYVFKDNYSKAKKHFEFTKTMLSHFDTLFGPYPFFDDGYGLVETPYWGMEHQGAIAYGNNFQLNEFGFDFILVHESAHEYWGNNISTSDHGAMYIQEGFCTYTESLLLERWKGTEAMEQYLSKQRQLIENNQPILGPLGINFTQNSTDIYYKHSLVLHTLRKLLKNDKKFFEYLNILQSNYLYHAFNVSLFDEIMKQHLGKRIADLHRFYLTNLNYPKVNVYIYNNKLVFECDELLLSSQLSLIMNNNPLKITFDQSKIILPISGVTKASFVFPKNLLIDWFVIDKR